MKKKTIFGFILVFIGMLFLLNRLKLITFNIGYIINTFWPLIFILFGLIILLRKIKFAGFALFIVVIGTLFQLKTLDIYDFFEEGLFWPIMIILAGILVFISRWKFNKKVSNMHKENKKYSFDEHAICSGKKVIYSSEKFLGGTAFAIFGGMDIDLRNAKLIENRKVKIKIIAIFGGIDVLIPKDWKIKTNGTTIFGKANNLTEIAARDDAHVIIEYRCIFGVCSILYPITS